MPQNIIKWPAVQTRKHIVQDSYIVPVLTAHRTRPLIPLTEGPLTEIALTQDPFILLTGRGH